MLDRFLNPKSIALFGASAEESKLRGRITRLIVENGYAGNLYFINPNHREVNGRPCHPNLAAVGETIDLAIIVVPAGLVIGTLEECAAAGVRNALIMSSGFAEEGGAQGDVQQRITEIGRRSGMRICGPNAEGFHSEKSSLSATFSPAVELKPEEVFTASRRQVGIIAQSGGIGFSLYHRGRHLGLSFGTVVTTGNEADLTTADFLQHMVDDPDTAAVLLFLETIRDGAGFVRALEQAAEKKKPVVVVKVGWSSAGARATVSHTGSMAGWDAAYDAMFDRHGVIVAEDLGRALAVVAGFVTNPLPKGRRAAVVTVSGGAGALAADRLTAAGFELPELRSGLQETIRGIIPSYGATGNPIDVTGQATRTGAPLRTMELLCDEDDIDVIVVACTMSNRTRPPVDIDGLRKLSEARRKPIFFFTYTLASDFGLRALADAGVVTFESLDDVTAAAAAMLRYSRHLDFQKVSPRLPPAAKRTDPLDFGAGQVAEFAAKDALEAYGIATAPRVLIRDESDISLVSADLFPVAAKIQSAQIPHKTEANGIRLNIGDEAALRAACAEILAAAKSHSPSASIDGVLVEPMARAGVEMIVGVVRDDTFGPVVTVGAGGVTAELLRDVARLQGPVSEAQATQMLRSLRSFPLLDGYRGATPKDVAALARLIAQVSEFAEAHRGQLRETELNPVIVHAVGEGLTIIDALLVADTAAETEAVRARASS